MRSPSSEAAGPFKVKVATKLPSWEVHAPADFDRFPNEQLARLQMDYVDFYLLHNIRKDYWEGLYNVGVLDWLEKALAGGRRDYSRMSAAEKASACVACHVCEDRCPQGIAISAWMEYIDEVFGQDRPYDPAERPQDSPRT